MSDELPIIPRADDAERTVLGVIFVAPNRFGEVVERIAETDFQNSLYAKIYAAMQRVESERRPIDEIVVAEALGDDAEFRAAGGVAFLTKIGDGVYGRAPLAEYCRIVKDASQRRELQRLLNSTSQRVQSRDAGTDELLEGLESSLSTLREGATRGAVHIGEVVSELGPILERVGAGKGVMFGVPTGFPDLDNKIAGWIPGDAIVLGARPSGGKTSLALEFGLRQARKGNAVALFSLEMDRASIMLRLACRDAGVSCSKTRSGWLSRAELSALLLAVARVSLLPFWIDDSASTSAYELRWRLRSLAQRHKIRLGIVDYLQLLRAKAENRTQEITKISIELKAAAKEIGQTSGGTLLILSQLSRMAADVRPQLHHLRESGQIEQDADSVFFLFDPEPTERGEPSPGRKTLFVAKQRNGPSGDVPLIFLPEVMGFEPAFSEGWEPDAKAAAAGESR